MGGIPDESWKGDEHACMGRVGLGGTGLGLQVEVVRRWSTFSRRMLMQPILVNTKC